MTTKKSDPSVLGSNISPIDAEALAKAVGAQSSASTTSQLGADVRDIDPAVLAAAIAYVLSQQSAQTEQPVVVAAPQTKPRMRKIILDPHDDIPTNGGLYVGYNGRQFLLPTSRAILVPQGVISVLDDAVQGIPVRDPDTLRLVDVRMAKRFQYHFTSDDPGADHIWNAAA